MLGRAELSGSTEFEPLYNRKQEGRCLTGTRLCRPNHVVARKSNGYCFDLYRGGLGIPLPGNGSQQLLRQPEGIECHIQKFLAPRTQVPALSGEKRQAQYGPSLLEPEE